MKCSNIKMVGHIPYTRIGNERAEHSCGATKFLRHIDSMVLGEFTYRLEKEMLFMGAFGKKNKNLRMCIKHFEEFAEELDDFARSNKPSMFTGVFADVMYLKYDSKIFIKSTAHGAMILPVNKVAKFIKEAREIVEDWEK